MKRPVVALVALGALLVTVLIVLRTREQRRGPTVPIGDVVPDARGESAELAPLVEPPPQTAERSALVAPARSQRETATGPGAKELARAHWVEGRVLFPAGTPSDEEVVVVAHGEEFFSDGEFQRARVEPDGRFRVAFAERSRGGTLKLEARFLYLDEEVRWMRGERTAEPIVLEPQLGARIAGRLLPPAGVAPGSVDGDVRLHRLVDASARRQGERAVARDLAFEFGALPAENRYRVVYQGDELFGTAVETAVEPGRITHVEITLELGAVVSGHVVDESGAAVDGITVAAIVELPDDARARYDKSDADGAFRIAALHGGEITLTVQARGYEDARYSVGTLEAGEVRDDIELVLRRGNSIAGRVQWPDGTPAEASLEALSETPPATTGRNRATSSADGAFEISGLGTGSYTVRATAKRVEEFLVWSELLGRERVRKRFAVLRASVEHVAVGTSALVLVLSAGLELGGRVVDDLGAPVRSFRVSASRLARRSTVQLDAKDQVGRSVQSEDGAFRVDGFTQGDWELIVTADGHGGGQPVRVSLPAAEPIAITLPREARIHGVVVDPAGTAVRAARVRAEQSTFPYRRDGDSATADERGAFALNGLRDTVTLTATADGWAPSERLVLELAPGETRTDVVLRLRHGCRITGEVRDRSGAGVRNAYVVVSNSSSHFSRTVATDAAGGFEMTCIPPGDVTVLATMPAGFAISERLALVAGETPHVVIAPKSAAIRLHGRVLIGGVPADGATVEVSRAGDLDGAWTTCDAAGQYELELDGAGQYTLLVDRDSAGPRVQTTVDVPDVEDFAFDVIRAR